MIDTQLTEFIDNSVIKLTEMQPSLENEKNQLMLFLQEKLLDAFGLKNVLISGRVKNPGSLKEKIIRKRYADKYQGEDQFISELPDIIGIRLVCLLKKEEQQVFSIIKRAFSKIVYNEFFVIPGTDEDSKYFAINLIEEQPQKQKNDMNIYRISCQWVSNEGKFINVELQIKSLIHMFWGEIEHMLFYKNYSYTVGANFYKLIMHSIYETLCTVDSQLAIMKNQMRAKNIKEQIDEIKQMLAKLMYNNYGPKFNELISCEIDLKEIYDLIVEMNLKGVASIEEAINKATSIMSNMNSQSCQLSVSTFNYSSFNEHSAAIADHFKPLAVTIDNLAHSKDLYWKALIGLYRVNFNPGSYTRVIGDISVKLMDFFIAFNDYIEIIHDEGNEILRKGIYLGITNAFNNYRKIDFFLPESHGNNILEMLKVFVNTNQEDFDFGEEELKHDKKERTINFVGFLVSLHILIKIGEKVSINDLVRIKEYLNDDMLLWKPEINSHILEDFIRENVFITEKDFIRLFQN